MARVVRLAAAALAVATAPHVARADGPPPATVQVYCQPGSLNNCFAFAIQGGDGRVTYWLQNLQGSVQSGGPYFAINSIIIQNSGTWGGTATLRYDELLPNGTPWWRGGGTSCDVDYVVGAVRTGSTCWTIDSNGGPTFQRAYDGRVGGFVGCTPTGPFMGEFFVAQTCLPEGLDGWLRFDASMRVTDGLGGVVRPGSADDLFIRIAGCDVFVGATSGYSLTRDCSSGIAYADLTGRVVTVTPEPASLTLLGSGLLGTGLFGTVRSRRKSA